MLTGPRHANTWVSLCDIPLYYDNVPGLYEDGMDLRTTHHLLAAPRKGTRASAPYQAVYDGRRGSKRNDFRPVSEGTHFARAEQKLYAEFMVRHGQPNFSGDDMNIIQVGRPAVSRYHQIRGFFGEGQGPNFAVHDFPSAQYGIKLGGFMLRGGFKCGEPRAKTWDY